ncbi:MAG: tRNA (adenosine(37)-N6)-dimethylallyltransferase MiaA [Bacteroidales bacterium]
MKDFTKPDLITLLGPTAVGKTRLAARLAAEINGQIISADSRQVYRGMNIGTGKDLDDYLVLGQIIPYHLIDLVEPGYEYSVFEFVNDFKNIHQGILNTGNIPILCGGTGLYLDAILRSYQLSATKQDTRLRSELQLKTDNELVEMLSGLRTLHNKTDIKDRERIIRAIEISLQEEKETPVTLPINTNSLVFGLRFERTTIRTRITARLKQRLDMGMVEEVRHLLSTGISPEKLIFYGLEYKYLTLFVTGIITFDEMFTQLNTGIHQFAKRQMTWFRHMERNGVYINWLEGEDGEDLNLSRMMEMARKV